MLSQPSALRAILAGGLPHLLASNVAQQAIAFATVLLIARLLPPEEFAIVRIALAYVAVAVVVAGAGLTAPVLRYCADPWFSGQQRRILLGISLRRLAAGSAATTALLLGLIVLLPRSETETTVFAIYALQLPGLAAATLLLVYLQADQQFRQLAVLQLLVRLVALLATGIATFFWGLAGLLAAALTVAYLSCLPLLKAARPLSGAAGDVALPADFSRLAGYSVLGTLITAVGQYADLMILDQVGTEKSAVAVYSLASIFFFSAVAVAGTAQGMATPAFTALINQPDKFRSQLRRWSVLLTLAGLPIAMLLVGLAWLVERYFLQPAYAGLSLILALLMIKFCIWCTYAIGGAALVGIGAIRQGTWVAAITTTLALVLGYPLCARYGIWGAALTQVSVAMVSAALVWWLVVAETRGLADRVAAREAP